MESTASRFTAQGVPMWFFFFIFKGTLPSYVGVKVMLFLHVYILGD
jgi:hypothetical protein